MSARNTMLRYGSVAMSFHWLIAALVVTNICLGLYMGELPRSDPSKFLIVQTHKSIGLTVLMLSVLRLGWRLINPIPPLPPMNAALRFTARATHYLFYFLIIAIPLAGWAMVSSSPLGNPTMYFGLFQWPNISFLSEMTRADKMHYVYTFAAVHNLLAFSAIALAVLHVNAALYHQFWRRDDVLKGMLPGTTVKDRT